jgi:UrcA family protein
MSRIVIKLLAAGAIAVTLSSTVHAQGPRSVTIHAQDLDLVSDAGRAVLQERIRGAANEVCRVEGWGAGLDALRAAEACKARVSANTGAQVEALLKAAQSRRLASRDISVTAH